MKTTILDPITTLADFKRAIRLPGATLERLEGNGHSYAPPRRIIFWDTVKLQLSDGAYLSYPRSSDFAVNGDVLNIKHLRMRFGFSSAGLDSIAT